MAIEGTTQGRAAEKDVGTLNSFLRGEISAVETYRQAMTKVEDATLRGRLEEICQSHEDRAAKLRNRIALLGGQPSEASGVWGGFAKLVEGGAKVFGVKAALAALKRARTTGCVFTATTSTISRPRCARSCSTTSCPHSSAATTA